MQPETFIIDLTYRSNGQIYHTAAPETPHFKLDMRMSGKILTVSINPAYPIEFLDFTVHFPRSFEREERIFVNGYQSWTDSLEYAPGGQMQELTRLTEFLVKRSPLQHIGFSKSGDLCFHGFPRKPGIFYGWSYGYIRNGDAVEVFGSLSERAGFTIVTFDTNENRVSIRKELEGVVYTEQSPLLSFAFLDGKYDDVFDEYFDKMGVVCREQKKRTGYTTWYNYYGKVNSGVVERDLGSIAEFETKIDCFQIDDGYQTAVGDWLQIDQQKFPNGMKTVADQIHKKDMLAGLWLAPFAGVPSSQLFKQHRDWFIKGANAKPYRTGHNWGGFYSLDIYLPEVRSYLRHVFDVVLNEWGYDLVKLDFLYGACVLPIHNKSRGQVMCDAMDLLRDCCGDKLILGCGVPLMPAFGKVDYCRIGPDISLDWKKRSHAIREEVSTPHAVCNTVFRRHLDGRAWMNDPDVFLLRDSNMKMTFAQRRLLSQVNALFGSLLFVSDDIAEYREEQLAALKEAFSKKKRIVTRAEWVGEDRMHIDYLEEGDTCSLRFHVSTGEYC